MVARLIADSERRVAGILDQRQLQRLYEVKLQVRGIRSVGDQRVAERLGLSTEQSDRVKEILDKSQQEMAGLVQQARSGTGSTAVEKDYQRLREQEQRDLIALLSPAQRTQLQGLIGRRFDVSRLGRVKFKAPPLIETDAWVNSPPIRITDLRGKVIALHFWAFG
jgi:hypothetical protein